MPFPDRETFRGIRKTRFSIQILKQVRTLAATGERPGAGRATPEQLAKVQSVLAAQTGTIGRGEHCAREDAAFHALIVEATANAIRDLSFQGEISAVETRQGGWTVASRTRRACKEVT